MLPQAKYYNFWNLFSAFAVPDQKGRDELETILQRTSELLDELSRSEGKRTAFGSGMAAARVS